MNKQMRGLGRGLDALIPTASSQLDSSIVSSDKEQIKEVAIAEITPNKYQPRIEFDDEALEELSASIKQYGVLQPVIVRRTLKGYELIAGERRLRASKIAGLKLIPAIIREYSDSEVTEIALIENLQREDLNAIEEALAYQRLINDFGLTQEELACKVGRSRSHIANFIRLLNLPSIIQDYVSRGTLTMGQARPLITLDNLELQIEAAEYIIAEDLSARGAEELVKKIAKAPRTIKNEDKPVENEIFVVEAEDRLKLALGTQVKIKPGKVKSKIEIEFYSAEDLDRIVEVLTMQISSTENKFKGNMIV